MSKEVSAEDIELVIDGFDEFINHSKNTNDFSVGDMKNFMEPIFIAAGYRDDDVNGETFNILILHDSSAGDFVAMTGTVREIRRLYPNAHITFVVNHRVGNLAEHCPYVDEIIIIKFVLDTGRELQLAPDDVPRLIKKCEFHTSIVGELLKRRYDIAIAPFFAVCHSTLLLAYMSGAKRRLSHHNRLWNPLLTDIVAPKPYWDHIVDKMFSYVEYLTGESVTNRQMEAWFSQDDLNDVKALIPQSKKVYALDLGSSVAKKRYPPEYYAAFMKSVIDDDNDVSFVLLGGSREVDASKIVAETVDPNRVINLVNKTSRTQDAALLSLCNVFIGNDTGTAQLAAAVHIPILVVHCFPLDLGRLDPILQNWHPYAVPSIVVCPTHALPGCKDSRNRHGCIARTAHCITQITPQNLFDALKILHNQIDKGANHYVLFDPKTGVNHFRDEMFSRAADERIQRVVDGFNNFINHVKRTRRFDANEMKRFMESIFTAEGYRRAAVDGNSDVNNVLICLESGTRDLIVTSAAIREIRRLYPNAHITLTVDQSAADVAVFCPHVSDVIARHFVIDDKAVNVLPNDVDTLIKKLTLHMGVARDLLRRRYDIAFAMLYSRPSTPLLAYMSGAKRIISHYNKLWNPLLTDIVNQKAVGAHMADKPLSYVEYLGGEPVTDRILEAWFEQDDVDNVKARMPQSKKIYSIGLGSRGTTKHRYPPKSYADLMNLIVRHDDDVKFIIVGDSIEEAQIIMDNVAPDCAVNLTGELTERQLLAALSLCNIHIGNLNALMQFAAAVHKPVLGVYCFPLEFQRPISEVLWWHPYNVPAVITCPSRALPECKDSKDWRGCAAKEPHCITQITPQDMFGAFKMLLKQIYRGSKQYVLFDPEKDIVQTSAEVPTDDIQLVIDGFKDYINRVIETKHLDVIEMKEFMEPLFIAAGYRDSNIDGEINNVLILHEGAAGDFIVLSAGIREIRRLYPNAHITLVADKRAENLSELCPHVDEIIIKRFVLDNGGVFQSTPDNFDNIIEKYLFHLSVAKDLLKRRYDVAFASVHSVFPSTPLLAYMSGSARRLSHGNTLWCPLLTDAVDQRNVGTHTADKMMSYVEFLSGEPVTNRRLEAWFNQDDIDAVKALVPASKKFYAIGLGGGSLRKHYPPRFYAKLMNLILQNDSDVTFLLLGGEKEIAEANVVMKNVAPEHVVNLAGEITYRQTGAALSLCDIYIGNDTGAAHLAAATNTPVLALSNLPLQFGNTNLYTRRWRPYDVPSVIVCPPRALPDKNSKDKRLITQIRPKMALSAFNALLKQIDRGAADYVIFDPEKRRIRKRRVVGDGDIQRVIDGFNSFIKGVEETGQFDAVDMKNFMEPIFTDAGYRKAVPEGKINSALILHESTAGDFIMMSAAIRELRRLYPKAYITLVVDKMAKELAMYCPYADEVIVKDFVLDTKKRTQQPPDDVDNIIRKCRFHLEIAKDLLARRYDVAFACLYGARPSTPLLAYMSGAKRIISHGAGMWEPLLCEVAAQKPNRDHAADRAFSYVEHISPAELVDNNLEMWYTQTDLNEIAPMMPASDKIYAINLWAGDVKERYPAESYVELIKMIVAADGEAHFVLIGDKNVSEDAATVVTNFDENRVINLVNKLSERQLAALFSRCKMYIGNENLFMQIAEASQVPILLVTGLLPTDAHFRRWGPYEVPSVIVGTDRSTEEEITPQTMFDAFKELLKRIEKGVV